MEILTNNPIDLFIELKGDRPLRSEDLFHLAEALDEYEIREKTAQEVVVDITEIRSDGLVTVRMTPKKKLTYEALHNHLAAMIPRALKRAGLEAYKYNLSEIRFSTLHPGLPSDIERELEEIKEVKARLTSLESEANRRIEQSNQILLKILEMDRSKQA